MNQDEQNDLAYQLANALNDAAEEFVKNHPQTAIPAMMGAGNIFLTGLCTNAPNKKEALKTLKENYKIMEGCLNSTPDAFFGIKNRTTLN